MFSWDDRGTETPNQNAQSSRWKIAAPRYQAPTASEATDRPILKSVRNTDMFLTDWSTTMERLTARILEEARQRPEGAAISAKALLHLGNRAAVDQTLSRLVVRGGLLRAGRGLYVLPVKGKFGVRAPSTRALLEQISEQTGETIVSSGAVAANRLGLTTQVPTQEVYLTSGRSRDMRLGQRVVTLRHAKIWELSLAKRIAGEAIRALGALGPLKIHDALVKLRHTLPPEEFRALTLAAGQVPTWMAEHLSRERFLG